MRAERAYTMSELYCPTLVKDRAQPQDTVPTCAHLDDNFLDKNLLRILLESLRYIKRAPGLKAIILEALYFTVQNLKVLAENSNF